MAFTEDSGRQLPWWLQAGSEECEFCLAAVHYEAFYHCRECDRPVCPGCSLALVETRLLLCPECAAGGDS